MFDLDSIKRDMKTYRMGVAALPAAYIELHRYIAVENLPELESHTDTKVLHTCMARDDWGDGMQVLRVIAEDSNHNLRQFYWSDANGGSWFEHNAKSFGQTLLFVPDNRPGYL